MRFISKFIFIPRKFEDGYMLEIRTDCSVDTYGHGRVFCMPVTSEQAENHEVPSAAEAWMDIWEAKHEDWLHTKRTFSIDLS
jgi:hypothetical protein